MSIKITATDAGFHFLNALGGEVAPDAFLVSRLNPEGALFQSRNGSTWFTEESYLNPIVSVEVSLAREAALPPGARSGDEAPLALSGLTFTRTTSDATEVIGEISFDGIMTVDAVFSPNGGREIGQGSQPNWIVEMGDDVLAAAQADGFEFSGSAGRDIFAPGADATPLFASGVLRGFAGDDELTAQAGGGELYGGQGDDVLSARGGVNAAWGGAGDDHIDFAGLNADQSAFGGRGHDTVTGGDGDDLIKGGGGRDHLTGGDGADTIKGGGGADRLIGGAGADRLIGNAGRDLLKGGYGDDLIEGGAGDDKLRGGAGADVFIFGPNSGDDVLTDFGKGADSLRFKNTDATAADLIFEETSRGTRVSYDGSDMSVLLLDVDATSLSGFDIFFTA